MNSIHGGLQTETGVLFGQWLVEHNIVSEQQLNEALAEQSARGGRLGEALIRLELADPEQITKALADYLDIQYFPLDDLNNIDLELARSIPENIAKRFCAVAADQDQTGQVIIVMDDPLNVVAIDTIRLKIKRPMKVTVGSTENIRKAIESIYHGSDIEEQELRDLVEVEVEASQEEETQEDGFSSEINTDVAAGAPVVRFVDLLMSQAIKSRASDLHIEPQEKTMSIRMRVDGVLREMVPPSRKMQAAVLARIKILSKMDIAERRLPQDGRFKVKAPGRDIDVRVSTIPTIYGEKIVMRILDKNAVNHDIHSLGMNDRFLTTLKSTLDQPHGIVIVTGPTGSGKSTTLYSALNYLKDPKKNITTVEDPVEYRLGGINQIQVRPDIELNFARCLRAILRQDPDIILIGEIRDKETVEIAIKASLTGHLVLSTFHTNDAPSALTRLAYMGLERYLLASTINLVVAQRLVRKICDHCKEKVKIEEELLERLKIEPAQADKIEFYHGKGCNHCNGSGYLGRLPIFEFMVMTNEIREAVVQSKSESEIKKLKIESGFPNLLQGGVDQLKRGLTTAEEVLRVTFADELKTDNQ